MATPSEELQKAIYDALIADADVSDVVGSRVYDRRPDDGDFPCITFGPADYQVEEMNCIEARVETMQIDCWARDGRRLRPARALADKVKAALHRADLVLTTHALAEISVPSVRAFMDRDELTGHGVVTVEALIEEK